MKLTKTLILIAALALGACTPQTTVEEVPNHQPANPKTWSPAGKVYVSENTCSGNGHDNWSAVFVFDKSGYAVWETYADDIFDKTQSPNFFTHGYQMEYPYLYASSDTEPFITFIDTCTFHFYDYVMKFYKEDDVSMYFLP